MYDNFATVKIYKESTLNTEFSISQVFKVPFLSQTSWKTHLKTIMNVTYLKELAVEGGKWK